MGTTLQKQANVADTNSSQCLFHCSRSYDDSLMLRTRFHLLNYRKDSSADVSLSMEEISGAHRQSTHLIGSSCRTIFVAVHEW